MFCLIDSDLMVLCNADSYVRDIVDSEITQVHKLESKYKPVEIHLNRYDIALISYFSNKNEVVIRLVF